MLRAELLDNETGEIVPLPSAGVAALELIRDGVSLTLPDALPFDEWLTIGKTLCHAEKGIQWWVGDWWAFGPTAYGDRAKAAAEDLFGRSFQGLINLGTVARAFESTRRRVVLPWSHHAEVASLPRDKADNLLDQAEQYGWSQKELRRRVAQVRNTAKIIGAEDPTSTYCKVDSLYRLIEKGVKFGAVYADPPWRYDNQGTRAATGNHYKAEVDENEVETQPASGMSVDELCALPVRELAADDAHLHLWTTNAFLFECPKIFEAWGFEFRSSFVWAKPQMGIGNYWRNSHEFLLTAIRGDAKRFNDRSLMSWLQCDRGVHSAKPEQVRSYIERASHGPYLEMFARRRARNWVVWGNQIEETLFDADVRDFA